jgi:hypothetical protein
VPQIELIRPLKLNPTGGSELVVVNRGSNNVYYGESAVVSSTNKIGTLNVGESLTLKKGFVWVVAERTPVILDLEEYELAGPTTSGGAEEASIEVSGITYASPLGNDSNSGASWATAKKTIQAAHDALPTTGEFLQNGKPVRVGVVELGAATGKDAEHRFLLKSELVRRGKLTFPGGKTYNEVPGKTKLKKEKGKPFVQVNIVGGMTATGTPAKAGAPASSTDIGKLLINPEAPAKTLEAAEILDYWEGEIDKVAISGTKGEGTGHKVLRGEVNPSNGVVCTATTTYYTLSKYVSKNETVLLYMVEPAVKISPGVTIRGKGPMIGVSGVGRKGKHGATVIEDQGTGLTFWIESASPKKPVEGRNTFEDFTLRTPGRPFKKETGWGEYNASLPIWGFYCLNVFGTTFKKLQVYGYTGWGAYIGNNAGAEFYCELCNFTENGNILSKIGPDVDKLLTGNLSSEGGTAIQSLYNNLFLNGFGVGATLSGTHCVGNSFNHAQQSTWNNEGTPQKLSNSGRNVLAASATIPTNIIGGWLEGGTVQVKSVSGYTTLMGVRCQGIKGESSEIGSLPEEGEEEEIEKWSSSEIYNLGDLVEYEKAKPKGSGIYESLQELNENHKPDTSPEWWEELIAAEYAVEGGCVLINCHFRQYQKACAKETGKQGIEWKNCSIGNPNNPKVERIPMIERTGHKYLDVPFLAASGDGSQSAAGKEETEGVTVGTAVHTTSPFPPEEVTLEAVGLESAVYTANEGVDVHLRVGVTFTATSTLVIARYAGEVGNEAWKVTEPTEKPGSAGLRNMRFYVKAGESIKFTTGGGTELGTARIQLH